VKRKAKAEWAGGIGNGSGKPLALSGGNGGGMGGCEWRVRWRKRWRRRRQRAGSVRRDVERKNRRAKAALTLPVWRGACWLVCCRGVMVIGGRMDNSISTVGAKKKMAGKSGEDNEQMGQWRNRRKMKTVGAALFMYLSGSVTLLISAFFLFYGRKRNMACAIGCRHRHQRWRAASAWCGMARSCCYLAPG